MKKKAGKLAGHREWMEDSDGGENFSEDLFSRASFYDDSSREKEKAIDCSTFPSSPYTFAKAFRATSSSSPLFLESRRSPGFMDIKN